MDSPTRSEQRPDGLMAASLAHLTSLLTVLRSFIGQTGSGETGVFKRLILKDVRLFLAIAENLLRRILLVDANILLDSIDFPHQRSPARTSIRRPEVSAQANIYPFSLIETGPNRRPRTSVKKTKAPGFARPTSAFVSSGPWLARLERVSDALANRSANALRLACMICRRRRMGKTHPLRTGFPPIAPLVLTKDIVYMGPLIQLHALAFAREPPGG